MSESGEGAAGGGWREGGGRVEAAARKGRGQEGWLDRRHQGMTIYTLSLRHHYTAGLFMATLSAGHCGAPPPLHDSAPRPLTWPSRTSMQTLVTVLRVVKTPLHLDRFIHRTIGPRKSFPRLCLKEDITMATTHGSGEVSKQSRAIFRVGIVGLGEIAQVL
jgi:hypothetical protein